MAFLDENGVSRLWTRVLSKLGSKVDKVDGKGLSTNDYTTEEKINSRAQEMERKLIRMRLRL